MCAFATLYSFEKNYNIRAYVTKTQISLFRMYFDLNAIKSMRLLQEEFPTWNKRDWIQPFP